ARHLQVGVTTTYVEGDARKVPRTATAIFQDISDQKRLETLRLRAERLEGVAELAASLAHEIKNPLAGIRSAVEQLSRMAAAGDDERVLTSLVIRESDRLSRLLSEFLDFARVRVTRLEPVDLVQVAEDAVALVAAHPERAEGVTIACVAAQRPVIVAGDDDLLHRAVFNLLLNAVQATPPGGDVRIAVLTESQEALPPVPGAKDGVVALRVSDTGPGIDPGVRDRLFDPFFTTKPGGSGLGLAVVQRAVEAHRGFVLLDSSTSEGDASGTRFTVILPRAADALGVVAPADPLPITTGVTL
ncbi:MAG: two-component system sensor histidine kinase NtrB, partial [Gemmatimonadaceae bacterium]